MKTADAVGDTSKSGILLLNNLVQPPPHDSQQIDLASIMHLDTNSENDNNEQQLSGSKIVEEVGGLHQKKHV